MSPEPTPTGEPRTTPDDPFAVTTSPHDADALLALAGRVDRDAEDPLLAAFVDVVTASDAIRRVVLDFHATSYINSSGLAAIVGLLTEARTRDVAVAARGLSTHYRHLFDITRLSDLVEVEPAT
jgi:anti-sigma B factor antagonist